MKLLPFFLIIKDLKEIKDFAVLCFRFFIFCLCQVVLYLVSIQFVRNIIMRFLAPTVITTERASSQLVCPFFPSFSRQSSDRQTENVLAERKERKKTKLVVDQSLKISRDKIQANQSVAHVLNCDNFHQISGIIIENQPKRRLQYLCHFVVVVVVKIFVVVIVLVIAVVTVYCAILTAAATASSPS